MKRIIFILFLLLAAILLLPTLSGTAVTKQAVWPLVLIVGVVILNLTVIRSLRKGW